MTNKQLYPAHPIIPKWLIPQGKALQGPSPNKANYFRPKHPSIMKTQVSGYKISFSNNTAQLTSNVLACMLLLSYIIQIKASHNSCQNLASYQTKRIFGHANLSNVPLMPKNTV